MFLAFVFNCASPGPINNTDLLCDHNKIAMNVPEHIFSKTSSFLPSTVENSPFQLLPENLFKQLADRFVV